MGDRKMKFKLVICIASFALATQATALECGPYDVISIQSQSTNVIVRVEDDSGKYWKNLGLYTDDWVNSYQSLAQQALAADKSVVLRFASDHDCSSSDYTTATQMIRIVK